MNNSSPPRVALVETENSIVYSNESFAIEDFAQEGNYRLYDILWSDGRASQSVRPVSDGVVPIGLCVIPTNWLDEGEKARFIALKYMSSKTPETGGLENELFLWGAAYGDVSPSPFENEEDDPVQKYYMPYVCKSEYYYNDISYGTYYWAGYGEMKDLRERENWLYTLNYCKENPGKYTIGDIDGEQNTINISVEGNYHETEKHKDMKPQVAKYAPTGTQAGDWYIPAIGELVHVMFRLRSDQNDPSINDKLALINKTYPTNCITNLNDNGCYYLNSNVYNSYCTFFISCSERYVEINAHTSTRCIYPSSVIAFLKR